MNNPHTKPIVHESQTAIDLWSDLITTKLIGLTHLHSVIVLAQTQSTQDAAATCELGCVVTTGRQTSGRGRLGNQWVDTGNDGLAVTFVVAAQSANRLAMAAAVATTQTLRNIVGHLVAARIGVKWPNDIVVARAGGAAQKIAGILIESKDQRALIGIGMNISQEHFPAQIADRAVSLRQLHQPRDRIAVLLELIQNLDTYLSASDRVIDEAYQQFDRTAGLRLKFLTPQGVVEGVVLRCDAAIGLVVQTNDGIKTLPAATTRVEP